MEIREMLVKFNSTKDDETLELVNEYVNDYKDFEEPHTFYKKMRDIVKDISDEVDDETSKMILGFVKDFDFFNENDFIFEKEIEVEEEEKEESEKNVVTRSRAATNFKLSERYRVIYNTAEKSAQEMTGKYVFYLIVNENNGKRYYGVCKGRYFGKFLNTLLDNYKCLKTGRCYNSTVNELIQNDFNKSEGRGFSITALKVGSKENLTKEKKDVVNHFTNKDLLYNIYIKGGVH